MTSSVLIGIPYHISDDKYYLDMTLLSIREKLGKDVDILIITDENTPTLSVPTKAYQTRVQGHGVGKARNAAGLYAYYNKYDCLIYVDSHMIIISDDYLKICNSKIGHPKIVLAEIYNGPMKDILKYIIPPTIDRSRYTLSSFLDKDTWRWAYIYSTMTNKTVMTTEPSYALSREVIEALIQAQGKLTLAEYWGKESFDLTISAARLGYTIDIYPTIEIAHIYKVGSPSWSSRFTETKCIHEPYCGVLSGSVYHNGIKWGDCVFALKHYSDISKLPVDKNVCEKVKKYDTDAMARIRQFNKSAKYTLDDVYRKLSEFLMGASYGFVS